MKENGTASSGFTITELMIATGLASFIFLVGSSVITQLFAFQKDVSTRLMDNFSLVSFHKVMDTDLEQSYWARLGAFSCPSSQTLMTTSSSDTVTLSGNSVFEFVKSDFSTTVGLKPGATDIISISTVKNLDVGDYVLLSLSTSASDAGLFKVRTIDRTKYRITLDPTDLNPGTTACVSSLPIKSLNDFFGPSVRSNVILSRVQVVRYIVQNGSLARQTLPGGGAENVVNDLKSMTIKGTWASSSEYADTAKKFGRMNFDVAINLNQSSLMGSNAKVNETQVINAQYDLNAFQLMNRYTSVGAPSAALSFPTCSVNYGFKPGALSIEADMSKSEFSEAYNNTVAVSITGVVSDSISTGTPSIDIGFTVASGGSISCFQFDADGDSAKSITGLGQTSSISMIMDGSGFKKYTCAVRGTVDLNASMTFFDSKIGQTRTIACSVDSIYAPSRYKFTAAEEPKCNRNLATIEMGSGLESEDKTISIGGFGIDNNKSCQWSDQPDDKQIASGIASDCDETNHVGQKLKRVFLRPYRMTVLRNADNAIVFDQATGAFIDCH